MYNLVDPFRPMPGIFQLSIFTSLIFICNNPMKVNLYIPLILYMIELALEIIGPGLRVTKLIGDREAYLEERGISLPDKLRVKELKCQHK